MSWLLAHWVEISLWAQRTLLSDLPVRPYRQTLQPSDLGPQSCECCLLMHFPGRSTHGRQETRRMRWLAAKEDEESEEGWEWKAENARRTSNLFGSCLQSGSWSKGKDLGLDGYDGPVIYPQWQHTCRPPSLLFSNYVPAKATTSEPTVGQRWCPCRHSSCPINVALYQWCVSPTILLPSNL